MSFQQTPLDTLQSLTSLDAENQLILMKNNLNAVAQALATKQSNDKTELSQKQTLDNTNALNLIQALSIKVDDALEKAESLGSAELAKIEASIKQTIEQNPALIAAAAGSVTIGGTEYTLSSALRALIVSPKVVSYENLRDSEGLINGAKIGTHDGFYHQFNTNTVEADGVKTVTFSTNDFYGSAASFTCVFESKEQPAIQAAGLSIALPVMWLPKSHTNIQITASDLTNYVPPAAFVVPDLNEDGVVGIGEGN